MMKRTRAFGLARCCSKLMRAPLLLGVALAMNVLHAQQSQNIAAESGATVPSIRVEVFDRLSEAQSCLDQGESSCAMQILDELSETPDLNAYEAGQLHNLYAFLYLERNERDEALQAYETIVALPHNELPGRLIGTALRNLATLYLEAGRLDEGLALYEQLFDLPLVTPSAYDSYMKASVLYQLRRHQDAIPVLREAIADGTDGFWRESAYELLYALQISTDDLDGALRTVQVLNSRWPKPEWADALELLERAGR